MLSSQFSRFKSSAKLPNAFSIFGQNHKSNDIDDKSNSTSSIQNAIITAITEYDQNIEEGGSELPQMEDNPQKDILHLEFINKTNPENDSIPIKNLYKKEIKPLRMFKDLIDLKKQNNEKKKLVSELLEKNENLKQGYYSSLKRNIHLQSFLKTIEFTFKNDESNQKANETLLKAKKNLQREEKESREYINKIWKKPKYNYMKELKIYLESARDEQLTQISLYEQLQAQNTQLIASSDLNVQQLQIFQECKQKIAAIMEIKLQSSLDLHQEYKKQKKLIKIHLLSKEINLLRKSLLETDEKIKKQLLQKEGIEYQLQIIKNRNKEKNKKQAKQTEKNLTDQVKNKKIKLLELRKKYKQKSKTNQYITKWTKQLKVQLQKLKETHSNVKEQYDMEINKLSTEIEQWNRKYKAELVQDQVLKRTSKNHEQSKLKNIQQINKNDNKSKQADRKSQSKIALLGMKKKRKEMTREEINEITKIIKFRILESENYESCEQFIKKEIIKDRQAVGNEQIKIALCNILTEDENPKQYLENINKLIKYIMDENYLQSEKQSQESAMDSKMCYLIMKNLLSSELTKQNLLSIKQELFGFMNKNYDGFRQNLWESSGKTLNFSIVTLQIVLRKYIANESQIVGFLEYFEFCLWRKFKSVFVHKLVSFELVCEDILGKKLAKDQNRVYRKITKSKYFGNMKQ